MTTKTFAAFQVALTILTLTGGVWGQDSQQAAVVGAGPRTTVSLDGPWRIVFDQDNVGHTEGWHKPTVLDNHQGRKILVPSCWEEHEQDYEGVAWYRRDFTFPANWRGRHIRLHFEAVNYRAEVWVNGEVVGSHEGGYGPFEFDISGHVVPSGTNTLIVRVVGPAVVSERVDDLVRNAAPHWRGGTAIWLKVPTTGEYHGQSIHRDPEKNYMMQLRGQKEPWRLSSSRLIEEGVFPLKFGSRTARGMWIPVGHYTRQHPIFDGLPTDGFMGQPYQNVVAVDTITNLPGNPIAGSLSWDIDRDYRGPTQWWHGTDVAVVQHGEGRMILSMLRIVENLGRDPVADKILFNVIKWAAGPDSR